VLTLIDRAERDTIVLKQAASEVLAAPRQPPNDHPTASQNFSKKSKAPPKPHQHGAQSRLAWDVRWRTS
jgi:hypothetical protein